MAPERIVVVGAGPAGLAAARGYREHGGLGSVLLLGEESFAPYRRPPLTKDFLRGELEVAELAIEQQRWFDENDVELRLGQRVSAIEPVQGTVTLGDERLPCDVIVLATGAEPQRPDLPGASHEDVATIRTLSDSIRLAERARSAEGPVLVLGTGFIGCEIAASLAMIGADVTLVGEEELPQSQRLGEQPSRRIRDWLDDLGVRFLGGAASRAIHRGRELELEDGSMLRGECVVLATGVRPRSELAQRAGLPLSDSAIAVDAQMRVLGADGKVFAVGDVALARNVAAGRALRVEHWADAIEHGEIAGAALAGSAAVWESVPGFWSTIGEHTLKYAGWGSAYERATPVEHRDGAFTVWYSDGHGVTVGVLTHERDDDYELGRELIAERRPPP